MTGLSKREQLIETAIGLFNRQGFNATGIDKILAEAGVAKMTLYKHFGTKDGLIQAVLRRRDEDFRNWLMNFVEREAETPRGRLLALFDAYGTWFLQQEFRGCMFLNAAAEFSGISDENSAPAGDHARLVQSYLRGLTAASGARNPDRLADWLMLLLDGAIGCAQVSLKPEWAMKARQAAEILIEAETGECAS